MNKTKPEVGKKYKASYPGGVDVVIYRGEIDTGHYIQVATGYIIKAGQLVDFEEYNWWKEKDVPPIGTELDGVKVLGCSGIKEWYDSPQWLVVGHHSDGVRFFVQSICDDSIQVFTAGKDEPQYRPVRSQKERVISRLVKILQKDHADATELVKDERMFMSAAEALYKQGVRFEDCNEV